jgi:hypothetical protein
VFAGQLPRDHLRHVWCERKCVPDFLHGEFLQALGDGHADPTTFLLGWYASVVDALPPGPIGDEPVKFWRAQFARAFPSGVPREPSRRLTEDAATQNAGVLELLKQRGTP